MICIFLYGVLFEGKREKMSLAVSGISAVGFTVVVWFVFVVFIGVSLAQKKKEINAGYLMKQPERFCIVTVNTEWMSGE